MKLVKTNNNRNKIKFYSNILCEGRFDELFLFSIKV